jgi:hypothetical protein
MSLEASTPAIDIATPLNVFYVVFARSRHLLRNYE